MNERTKQGLIIAAFGLLAVLAVAGWVRKPELGANYGMTSFNTPGVYTQSSFGQPAYGTPVSYDASGRPIYGQPAPATAAAYPPQQYAAQNCVEPMGYQTAAWTPAPERYARSYRERPRVARTYVQRDRDYVVRRKRSTGKSVAIVAGSAGAGAAIGALAGGGKGAAIGGLTGGVAGFVYDRLTHNR